MKLPLHANLLLNHFCSGASSVVVRRNLSYFPCWKLYSKVKMWSGSPVSRFQLSWLVRELILLAAKINLTYFEASGSDKDAGPSVCFDVAKKQLLCFRAEIHILWKWAHGQWPSISEIAAQGKAALVQKLVWTKLRENNSESGIS